MSAADSGLTTLAAEAPIEGLYQVPLALRISADGQTGSAVSPLMNPQGDRAMPKYIYPLTRAMSSVVGLAISLIPVLKDVA